MHAERQFLVDVRYVRVAQVYGIYEKYIQNNTLNLSHAQRQAIDDNFAEPADEPEASRRTSRRFRPLQSKNVKGLPRLRKSVRPGTSVHPVFEAAQQEVERLFEMNYFTNMLDPQSFWRSPVFLAMHEYRTRRVNRVWRTTKHIPAKDLSQQAFDRLAETGGGYRTPAQIAASLGVSLEEYMAEMEGIFD